MAGVNANMVAGERVVVPSVSNYKHIPSGCAELETEGNAVVDQLITTPKGCGYNWHSTVRDNLDQNEMYFVEYKDAPGSSIPGIFIGVQEPIQGTKMYMFKYLEPEINNDGHIIQDEFGGEWHDIKVFKAVAAAPAAAAPAAAAPAGGAGAQAAPAPIRAAALPPIRPAAAAAAAAYVNEDPVNNNARGGGRRRKTRNMRKRSRKNTRKMRK
jgi:hypothetical protein